jgi:phage shock protein E
MKTIQEILDSGNATIIDVRTSSEFAVSHFPNAINIPLDELPKHLHPLKTDNKPVILYCRSGNRSGIGMNFLHQQGLKEVYNGGGLSDMLQYKN